MHYEEWSAKTCQDFRHLDVAVLQGRKLRFSQSQSKHRLFVGNIPKTWEKEELESVLSEQGPGIQSVELLKVEPCVALRRSFRCLLYRCRDLRALLECLL